MSSRHTPPPLITDAPQSPAQQRRSREVRYLVMMGFRILCLVLAAVLAGAQAPMLWLWLTLCGLGMVLLPWLAVLVANDRPAKAEHRWRSRTPDTLTPRSLPPRPAGDTIDPEP